MKALHVLVVTTWYPNGQDKLIGIYHKLFCKALAEKGVKVNMLYVDRQGLSDLPRYPMMKKRYAENCEGYTTYGIRMMDVSRFSFDLQMKLYAKRLLKLYKAYEKLHGKPDLIHAQVAVPGGYAACKLGEKIGVPVMVTEHSSNFTRFFDGREAVYNDFVMQKASKITCVGNWMVDVYREKAGKVAQVLPNIVDCRLFQSTERATAVRDEKPLQFISVCALREGKCIDDAIRALKLYQDQPQSRAFSYVVVGDGPELPKYRAAAEACGLTAQVQFVGRKTPEEVAEYYSQSDIFIMSADLETFGIPAVEALASGVPVVSTRCKGPEGFLPKEASELCAVHDPADMAGAIARMVSRLENIDVQCTRAAAAQFDNAAVVERAIEMYEEICN